MGSAAPRKTANPGAPNVPFYTPAQVPAAGTALVQDDPATAPPPTLFRPLPLRGVTLDNRFIVSPMCQYSADDGHLTDYHLVHLGQFSLHGAALVIVEATAVHPAGRISPEDAGLWRDSQVAPLRRVADFAHSQGKLLGVQLAHAGRKASTLAPWLSGTEHKALADVEEGGWPDEVVGPSALAFAEGYAVPRALSVDEIRQVVRDFADAAVRAVKAGVDVIEIHGAHGYLITEFMSPLSNTRTDQYGGSFENRTRLLLEVIRAVRAVIPETMPLLVRISATEWMEHAGQPSWDLASSIQLAKLLPALGVDLLDVSSGGNSYAQQFPRRVTYQTDLAAQIRAALRADGLDMPVGALGLITGAEQARDLLEEGKDGSPAAADVVIVARQFLREPNFVLAAAEELGVPVQWPHQYHRAPPIVRKPKA